MTDLVKPGTSFSGSASSSSDKETPKKRRTYENRKLQSETKPVITTPSPNVVLPNSSDSSVSRYGRTRKPKINEDFYNIDEVFEQPRTPLTIKGTKKYGKKKLDISPTKSSDSLKLELKTDSVNAEKVLTDELLSITIPEDSVDVSKILKIVSNKSPTQFSPDSSSFSVKPLKTYGNRRKRSQSIEEEDNFDFPNYPEELECTFNSDSESSSECFVSKKDISPKNVNLIKLRNTRDSSSKKMKDEAKSPKKTPQKDDSFQKRSSSRKRTTKESLQSSKEDLNQDLLPSSKQKKISIENELPQKNIQKKTPKSKIISPQSPKKKTLVASELEDVSKNIESTPQNDIPTPIKSSRKKICSSELEDVSKNIETTPQIDIPTLIKSPRKKTGSSELEDVSKNTETTPQKKTSLRSKIVSPQNNIPTPTKLSQKKKEVSSELEDSSKNIKTPQKKTSLRSKIVSPQNDIPTPTKSLTQKKTEVSSELEDISKNTKTPQKKTSLRSKIVSPQIDIPTPTKSIPQKKTEVSSELEDFSKNIDTPQKKVSLGSKIVSPQIDICTPTKSLPRKTIEDSSELETGLKNVETTPQIKESVASIRKSSRWNSPSRNKSIKKNIEQNKNISEKDDIIPQSSSIKERLPQKEILIDTSTQNVSKSNTKIIEQSIESDYESDLARRDSKESLHEKDFAPEISAQDKLPLRNTQKVHEINEETVKDDLTLNESNLEESIPQKDDSNNLTESNIQKNVSSSISSLQDGDLTQKESVSKECMSQKEDALLKSNTQKNSPSRISSPLKVNEPRKELLQDNNLAQKDLDSKVVISLKDDTNMLPEISIEENCSTQKIIEQDKKSLGDIIQKEESDNGSKDLSEEVETETILHEDILPQKYLQTEKHEQIQLEDISPQKNLEAEIQEQVQDFVTQNIVHEDITPQKNLEAEKQEQIQEDVAQNIVLEVISSQESVESEKQEEVQEDLMSQNIVLEDISSQKNLEAEKQQIEENLIAQNIVLEPSQEEIKKIILPQQELEAIMPQIETQKVTFSQKSECCEIEKQISVKNEVKIESMSEKQVITQKKVEEILSDKETRKLLAQKDQPTKEVECPPLDNITREPIKTEIIDIKNKILFQKSSSSSTFALEDKPVNFTEEDKLKLIADLTKKVDKSKLSETVKSNFDVKSSNLSLILPKKEILNTEIYKSEQFIKEIMKKDGYIRTETICGRKNVSKRENKNEDIHKIKVLKNEIIKQANIPIAETIEKKVIEKKNEILRDWSEDETINEINISDEKNDNDIVLENVDNADTINKIAFTIKELSPKHLKKSNNTVANPFNPNLEEVTNDIDYESDSSIESPMFEKHISVESPIFKREDKHTLAQKILDFKLDVAEIDLSLFDTGLKCNTNSPISEKEIRGEIQKIIFQSKDSPSNLESMCSVSTETNIFKNEIIKLSDLNVTNIPKNTSDIVDNQRNELEFDSKDLKEIFEKEIGINTENLGEDVTDKESNIVQKTDSDVEIKTKISNDVPEEKNLLELSRTNISFEIKLENKSTNTENKDSLDNELVTSTTVIEVNEKINLKETEKERERSSSPDEFDHLPIYTPLKKSKLPEKENFETNTETKMNEVKKNDVEHVSNDDAEHSVTSTANVELTPIKIVKPIEQEITPKKIILHSKTPPSIKKDLIKTDKQNKLDSKPKKKLLGSKNLRRKRLRSLPITKPVSSSDSMIDSEDSNLGLVNRKKNKMNIRKKIIVKKFKKQTIPPTKTSKVTKSNKEKISPLKDVIKGDSVSKLELKLKEDMLRELELQKTESLDDQNTVNFKLGTITWSRVGTYPYWPSIITNEPNTNCFAKNVRTIRGIYRFQYHVNFFGDNGRRSWIPISHIFEFKSQNDLQEKLQSLKNSPKPNLKPKDPDHVSAFIVNSSKRQKWDSAVSEAESIFNKSLKERIRIFNELLSKPKKIEKSLDKPNLKRKLESHLEEDKEVIEKAPKRIKLDETSTIKIKNNERKKLIDNKKIKKMKKKIVSAEDLPLSQRKLIIEDNMLLSQRKLKIGDVPLSQRKLKTEENIPLSQRKIKTEENIPLSQRKIKTEENISLSQRKLKTEENISLSQRKIKTSKEIENVSMIKEKISPKIERLKIKSPKIESPKIQSLKIESPKIESPKIEKDKKLSKPKNAIIEHLIQESNIVKKKSLNVNIKKRLRYSDPTLKKESKNVSDESLSESEISKDNQTVTRRTSSPIPIIPVKPKRVSTFKGVSKERVCQLCYKPGKVIRCKGTCNGLFHINCDRKANNITQINSNDFEESSNSTVDSKDSVDAILNKHNEEFGKDFSFKNLNLKKRDDASDTSSNVSRKSSIVGLENHEACFNKPASKHDINSNKNDKKEENDENDIVIRKSEISLSLAEQIDAKMQEVMQSLIVTTKYSDSTTDDSSESDISEVIPQIEIKEETKKTIDENNAVDNQLKIIKHITADNVMNKIVFDTPKESNFRCTNCTLGIIPPCFVCGKNISKIGNEKRKKCAIVQCGKYYHRECLKEWPQTKWLYKNKGSDDNYEEITCPLHSCHTCISDDPRTSSSRFTNEKQAKCLRCPTTYHICNYCLPAGTEILANYQIICPKHYQQNRRTGKAKTLLHVNASWCFICAIGGSLICCENCPASFHAECLKINPPEGSFICEDCESGRLPLYNEIVWVKLGAYRWWPAQILHPSDIPENVRNIAHGSGEFVVRFFGSHDHYWVNRGRVFLFQDGDSGQVSSKKSTVDGLFLKAIEEARERHKLVQQERESRSVQWQIGMKPPSYIKIKYNRPFGNVRLVDADTSNTTPCDCNPSSGNPCGPDSDCLNRILMTECNPMVCAAGERCCNQAFEKCQYSSIIPFKTSARGWGLKALVAIPKGSFVIEYVGEVIDENEYKKRIWRKHELKDENYYFLTIDKDRMIDAGPKGNVARFMNHSCAPNCETQKWTVNGDTRVGLFAIEDIPVDAELTFNYNLECIGEEKKICRCGAHNCSGFIGVKVKTDEKKKSKMKKKKPVPVAEVPMESVQCFVCGEMGAVQACGNKNCDKQYHLKCLKLDTLQEGRWICPWHSCKICTKRTTRCCHTCINSFCPLHSQGNIRYDKTKFVCKDHDTSRKGKYFKTRRSELEMNIRNKKTIVENIKKRTLKDESDSEKIFSNVDSNSDNTIVNKNFSVDIKNNQEDTDKKQLKLSDVDKNIEKNKNIDQDKEIKDIKNKNEESAIIGKDKSLKGKKIIKKTGNMTEELTKIKESELQIKNINTPFKSNKNKQKNMKEKEETNKSDKIERQIIDENMEDVPKEKIDTNKRKGKTDIISETTISSCSANLKVVDDISVSTDVYTSDSNLVSEFDSDIEPVTKKIKLAQKQPKKDRLKLNLRRSTRIITTEKGNKETSLALEKESNMSIVEPIVSRITEIQSEEKYTSSDSEIDSNIKFVKIKTTRDNISLNKSLSSEDEKSDNLEVVGTTINKENLKIIDDNASLETDTNLDFVDESNKVSEINSSVDEDITKIIKPDIFEPKKSILRKSSRIGGKTDTINKEEEMIASNSKRIEIIEEKKTDISSDNSSQIEILPENDSVDSNSDISNEKVLPETKEAQKEETIEEKNEESIPNVDVINSEFSEENKDTSQEEEISSDSKKVVKKRIMRRSAKKEETSSLSKNNPEVSSQDEDSHELSSKKIVKKRILRGKIEKKIEETEVLKTNVTLSAQEDNKRSAKKNMPTSSKNIEESNLNEIKIQEDVERPTNQQTNVQQTENKIADISSSEDNIIEENVTHLNVRGRKSSRNIVSKAVASKKEISSQEIISEIKESTKNVDLMTHSTENVDNEEITKSSQENIVSSTPKRVTRSQERNQELVKDVNIQKSKDSTKKIVESSVDTKLDSTEEQNMKEIVPKRALRSRPEVKETDTSRSNIQTDINLLSTNEAEITDVQNKTNKSKRENLGQKSNEEKLDISIDTVEESIDTVTKKNVDENLKDESKSIEGNNLLLDESSEDPESKSKSRRNVSQKIIEESAKTVELVSDLPCDISIIPSASIEIKNKYRRKTVMPKLNEEKAKLVEISADNESSSSDVPIIPLIVEESPIFKTKVKRKSVMERLIEENAKASSEKTPDLAKSKRRQLSYKTIEESEKTVDTSIDKTSSTLDTPIILDNSSELRSGAKRRQLSQKTPEHTVGSSVLTSDLPSISLESSEVKIKAKRILSQKTPEESAKIIDTSIDTVTQSDASIIPTMPEESSELKNRSKKRATQKPIEECTKTVDKEITTPSVSNISSISGESLELKNKAKKKILSQNIPEVSAKIVDTSIDTATQSDVSINPSLSGESSELKTKSKRKQLSQKPVEESAKTVDISTDKISITTPDATIISESSELKNRSKRKQLTLKTIEESVKPIDTSTDAASGTHSDAPIIPSTSDENTELKNKTKLTQKTNEESTKTVDISIDKVSITTPDVSNIPAMSGDGSELRSGTKRRQLSQKLSEQTVNTSISTSDLLSISVESSELKNRSKRKQLTQKTIEESVKTIDISTDAASSTNSDAPIIPSMSDESTELKNKTKKQPTQKTNEESTKTLDISIDKVSIATPDVSKIPAMSENGSELRSGTKRRQLSQKSSEQPVDTSISTSDLPSISLEGSELKNRSKRKQLTQKIIEESVKIIDSSTDAASGIHSDAPIIPSMSDESTELKNKTKRQLTQKTNEESTKTVDISIDKVSITTPDVSNVPAMSEDGSELRSGTKRRQLPQKASEQIIDTSISTSDLPSLPEESSDLKNRSKRKQLTQKTIEESVKTIDTSTDAASGTHSDAPIIPSISDESTGLKNKTKRQLTQKTNEESTKPVDISIDKVSITTPDVSNVSGMSEDGSELRSGTKRRQLPQKSSEQTIDTPISTSDLPSISVESSELKIRAKRRQIQKTIEESAKTIDISLEKASITTPEALIIPFVSEESIELKNITKRIPLTQKSIEESTKRINISTDKTSNTTPDASTISSLSGENTELKNRAKRKQKTGEESAKTVDTHTITTSDASIITAISVERVEPKNKSQRRNLAQKSVEEGIKTVESSIDESNISDDIVELKNKAKSMHLAQQIIEESAKTVDTSIDDASNNLTSKESLDVKNKSKRKNLTQKVIEEGTKSVDIIVDKVTIDPTTSGENTELKVKLKRKTVLQKLIEENAKNELEIASELTDMLDQPSSSIDSPNRKRGRPKKRRHSEMLPITENINDIPGISPMEDIDANLSTVEEDTPDLAGSSQVDSCVLESLKGKRGRPKKAKTKDNTNDESVTNLPDVYTDRKLHQINEVKLTSIVPERHLRVMLRKNSDIDSKNDSKFMKMQDDIERDLPIRKRSKLRYEAQL